MKSLLLALFMLCCAMSHVHAWQSETGAAPDPDNEWRKSAGEFGAMMFITGKYQEFIEAWEKPASPTYVPNISTTETAVRGQTVRVMVMFANCTEDKDGNCHVLVDFTIKRPDGTIYASFKEKDLWKGKKPPKNMTFLGNASLGVEIEQDDPYGVYKIQASIRDLNGGHSFDLVQHLTVKQEN